MEKSIAEWIALLAQFISLTLSTPSSFTPSSVSLKMIPSVENRIVMEGTFNIVCRFTDTNYTGSVDHAKDDYIDWILPIVLVEDNARKKVLYHNTIT